MSGDMARDNNIWAVALVALTLAFGCEREEVEPLPIPKEEHAKPQPTERPLGRLVKEPPATLENALQGRTRAELRVSPVHVISDGYFSWLKVKDDSATAWAVVPPLEATPTGDVTLRGWVLGSARGAPAEVGPHVLWASQIVGEGVRHRQVGEEAVFDPVFAAMEVTGSVAKSEPPKIEAATHTVRDCVTRRAQLRDAEVQVRGQIVHIIADLGGSAWWLLRDGLGDVPSDAVILARAQGVQQLGEVVLVQGKLRVDVRFRWTTPIPALIDETEVLESPDSVTPTVEAAEPAAADR